MSTATNSWSAPAFEFVAAFVRERAGLEFLPNRRRDFESGMRRVMVEGGFDDAARFLARLQADEALLDALVAQLTVGETYFFREPGQFDSIRDVVLRDWANSPRANHFRAWSAGCASGEEAYSLAILLEQQGLERRSHVLGTDISRPFLARAREAVYGQWSLRSTDEAFTARYFDARAERWALHPRFRERVAFEYLNLAWDNFPSLASGAWGMDLILCRNVLIYFDKKTIRRVADRLRASLADGGWLITGPSDPPLGGEGLEAVVTPGGVFYRARGSGGGKPSIGVQKTHLFLDPAGSGAPPFAASSCEIEAESKQAPVEQHKPDAAVEAVLLRALANERGCETAALAAADAVGRHPLSAELHFLRALLAMEMQDYDQAARSLRRTLYLDRSLAIAHFTLGCILRRRRNKTAARRAFDNALSFCLDRPADEFVPLSDGERVEQLIRAARTEIALLETDR